MYQKHWFSGWMEAGSGLASEDKREGRLLQIRNEFRRKLSQVWGARRDPNASPLPKCLIEAALTKPSHTALILSPNQPWHRMGRYVFDVFVDLLIFSITFIVLFIYVSSIGLNSQCWCPNNVCLASMVRGRFALHQPCLVHTTAYVILLTMLNNCCLNIVLPSIQTTLSAVCPFLIQAMNYLSALSMPVKQ